MSLTVGDATGQQWLTAFNDTGHQLLGYPADVLVPIKEQESQKYASIIKQSLFKTFVFHCRAKNEMYQNEQKLKVSIVGLDPVDWRQETNNLFRLIEKYN